MPIDSTQSFSAVLSRYRWHTSHHHLDVHRITGWGREARHANAGIRVQNSVNTLGQQRRVVLTTHLPAATRVLDAFHLVKLALLLVDQVRSRVQQHTTGHRGRADDPLHRARRILRRRHDRLTDRQLIRLRDALTDGDPNEEIAAAWLVAQRLMQAYANPDRSAGKASAQDAITLAKTCPVPEIARLGRTLHAWRTEFLARFGHPDVSNGPTGSSTSRSRTANASPAATDRSATTVCDYFSTTASSGKINKQHGSEPADPAWLRRVTFRPIATSSRRHPRRTGGRRLFIQTASAELSDPDTTTAGIGSVRSAVGRRRSRPSRPRRSRRRIGGRRSPAPSGRADRPAG